MFKTLLT